MLSRLVRILLALTSIAPLSISLAYVFAARQNNLQLAIVAALVCILLGASAIGLIDKAGRTLERLPVTIKKAKSADKEVIGFFVAYALPLLFGNGGVPDIGAWLMAAALLLFVLWSTHALQVNPVLGIFGFHFYEVESEDGITYLLITRRRINSVRSISSIVQLSEYGVLEARNQEMSK